MGGKRRWIGASAGLAFLAALVWVRGSSKPPELGPNPSGDAAPGNRALARSHPAPAGAALARRSALHALVSPDPGGSEGRLVLRRGGASVFFETGRIGLSLAAPGGRGGWGIHWGPVGSRPVPPDPRDEASARVSHFGGGPGRRRTGLPTYGRVVYEDLRPGVAVHVEPVEKGLKYDLHFAPEIDATALSMAYEGALEVRPAPDGSALDIVTGAGVLREDGLQCFQDGRRLRARYVARGTVRYGYEIDGYDPSRPLHLDPVISWSSFHGGAWRPGQYDKDDANAVAVDSAGNVYVAGVTDCSDFPVAGPIDPGIDGLWGQTQAFVSKLAADGSSLVWSTYLGGTGHDAGRAVAVDAAGGVYVAGYTQSSDFPIVGGFDSTLGSSRDVFVARISPAGDALAWSTFLGGNNVDEANGMALDATGVYVAGRTTSTDFPVAGTVFGPAYGSNGDGFVSKLALDGSSLVWSTYLGGSSIDEVNGLAVDASGAVYAVGETWSTDFPVAGGFDSTQNGSFDGFVTKIHPSGASLVWSSFVGSPDQDESFGVAVDSSGNAYVAGATRATPSSLLYQGTVARVNADGASVAWSIVLGGTGAGYPSNDDFARGVAVGADGFVYVAGETGSPDFPTPNGFDSTLGLVDAFVSKLNPGSGAVVWSSFFGGSGWDVGRGIAVDASNNAVIVGTTASADLPSAGGLDTTLGGAQDGFVAKVNAAGTSLAWSTYLGGAYGPAQDDPAALAVDAAGNLYVAGSTFAYDFATPGAFDVAHAGWTDATVTKIQAGGSAVAWSAYLGGANQDAALGVAVDALGAVYVVGRTDSSDFPTVSPWDPGLSGTSDAFVAKIAPAGDVLLWSSYLGGSQYDSANAVVVDGPGNVYVAGGTGSSDFPVPGGYDTALASTEAFVVKVAASGSGLAWGTFLGGSAGEDARAIALDAAGNVVVVGHTYSTDFPLLNAFQSTPGTFQNDAFVTKLAPSGASLVWSSRLGGNNIDEAYALAVGADGALYVAGRTTSLGFATPGAADTVTNGNDEGFVAKILADGSARVWCTYVGGSGHDVVNGVAVDDRGEVYVTGRTSSTDLDVRGGFDVTFGLSQDAFVGRINGDCQLDWMSYLGGRMEDSGLAIAVDGASTVHVLGRTASPDFPLAGAFDAQVTDHDGFLVRIQDPGPPVPRSPVQARANGFAVIDAGGWTPETALAVKALLHQPAGGTLRLQVQLRPVDVAFDGAIDAETALLPAGTVASLLLTGLADGTQHHWRVRSMDAGGIPSAWVPFGANADNPPNAVAARDVGVDTEPPVLAVTSASPSLDQALVSGTASDNRSTPVVRWINTATGESGSATGTPPNWSAWIPLRNGDNPIVIVAWDAAGNASTANAAVTRNPPATPPTVQVTAPAPGAVVAATPLTVTGAASAPSGFDGVRWRNETSGASGLASGGASWTALVPLVEGANTLRITVRDLGRNEASATLAVTLAAGADASPPSVAITSPAGPAFAAALSPLALGGTASDDVGVSHVRWAVGAAGPAGVAAGGAPTWSANVALVPGDNPIAVTAVDPAGNEATAALSATFSPQPGDPIPPHLQILTPGSSGTFNVAGPDLLLGGLAVDNLNVPLAGVFWSNAATGERGSAEGLGAWSATVALAPGSNDLTVTAFDSRGNSTSVSILVNTPLPPPAGGGGGGGGGCGALGLDALLAAWLLARAARGRARVGEEGGDPRAQGWQG